VPVPSQDIATCGYAKSPNGGGRQDEGCRDDCYWHGEASAAMDRISQVIWLGAYQWWAEY